MRTELGNVTHRYWWNENVYYRSSILTGVVEKWEGNWVIVETMRVAA